MAEAALGGRSIIKYAGHRVGLDYTEVCVCVSERERERERERAERERERERERRESGAGLFVRGVGSGRGVSACGIVKAYRHILQSL